MPSIHFICRGGLNVHRVPGSSDYESGDWDVTVAEAQRLVGEMVYLHEAKVERSYYGGRVRSFRTIVTDSPTPFASFSGSRRSLMPGTSRGRGLTTQMRGLAAWWRTRVEAAWWSGRRISSLSGASTTRRL